MSFLNDEQRTELKTQHKQERDGRVRDRIKAVLLADKGWSPQQIAEALLISDQAVRNHLNDYKKSQKLSPESGGSLEKLSLEQSLNLEAHLQEHTYLYVKDIVAYVKISFEVEYTTHGMLHWLKRHGFSYKKPAVIPGKANEQQQREWIKEYQKLRGNLPDNETICFIDGVHPTHNVQPTYGWIKKGVRKEIPANSGRKRLNLSGMIDIIQHKVLVQEDLTLNAQAIIRFFKKIEEAYSDKKTIHIFLDNAPYHRNKKVKEYLENSKIILHFLPPYSPNLNPIERLWKWMKERVIHNEYYEDFDDFRVAILGFFALLNKLTAESMLGKSFRCRVKDNFRPIGAPAVNY
jgi:transposase